MVDTPEPVLMERHENKDTVTLILSGGEILEIAAASLPADLPPVGQKIPATLVCRLREAATRKKIARRLFQLLDRRLYANATLKNKLQQEGFASASIEAVLASFAEAELHSDHHFATAFCRDTLRRRPVGPQYLRARLRQQGVEAVVVDKVLREIVPPDRERELALVASLQRWRRLPSRGIRNAEAKVYRFLLNRGFSGSVARQAARAGADQPGGQRGEEET